MTKSAQLTFPFNINFDNYNSLEIGHELTEAGQSGDLSPLHRLKSEFGGVSYDTQVAKTALNAGQIDFWREYVMLARWECIVLERGTIGSWVPQLWPVLDILGCEAGDQVKFQAFKFAIEEFLPNLPSRDDFDIGDEPVHYYDHPTILPPHRFSIWCLENFREFPKTADGDLVIEIIIYRGNRDMIELLIKNGVKFSLEHLQRIAFKYRPDLYHLVLQNLRPHIDRENIPISCQYHASPNDADLLYQIAFAAKCAHYRETESLNDLDQFLKFNSDFISKLPATVEFFQKVLDGHDFTKEQRDQIAEWFYYFCRSQDKVSKALEISQNLLERFKDCISMEAPLEFPCMSRSDRMESHRQKGTEDIPEDERFVSDGYKRFPEPDDNDDYAAWMDIVGHGYFEDFLGVYEQEESSADSEDDEYSNDEDNEDFDDQVHDDCSYDNESEDDEENDQHPYDEECGDYQDHQGHDECSYDEESEDDEENDQRTYDEVCGDYQGVQGHGECSYDNESEDAVKNDEYSYDEESGEIRGNEEYSNHKDCRDDQENHEDSY